MKLIDLLEEFEMLQRVNIGNGEECVTGEVCAMKKLLSEETLALEVQCAMAENSV